MANILYSEHVKMKEITVELPVLTILIISIVSTGNYYRYFQNTTYVQYYYKSNKISLHHAISIILASEMAEAE